MKALHSLLIVETWALAIRTENVTNLTTLKGKLGIVSLSEEELGQVYLKSRTDLYVFIFGGREFQTDDPENAKPVLYRSIIVRGKT